jgi:hypothetical protein
MNEKLIDYIPHMHLTLQGIIDLDHPYKNPRPIFDSSFHPKLDSYAINDWMNKCNKPPLVFVTSFMTHLTWLWNLRITCPCEEIYIGNNNILGAFNQKKYNPRLVALHTFVLLTYSVMNTGSTFGNNSSPGNFEPLTQARQQHAKYLWGIALDHDMCEHMARYKINIMLVPPPTPGKIMGFSLTTADSLNPGVQDINGKWLPASTIPPPHGR